MKSIDQQTRTTKGSDEDSTDAKIIDVLQKLESEKFNVPYVSRKEFQLFKYLTVYKILNKDLVTYSTYLTLIHLKIVSAGIQTLFDIISETKHQHPLICSKALSSLFDIFQGENFFTTFQ